ncbi:FAD/NAD(P)-binding protein [Helicobacter bilis]|uniref:FAD/NAD(P)-binding protein n=2 Tax=Helicobacter bilis TaxID=37372 RepID=A0A6D2CEZ6_9HELI|nr:FAD/NAD(P)-binding protein [Helicobacter bilis]EMZ39889.1 hypothetical protein C826_00711 [Helicobacter bilis WiWa]TLE06082.1 FAD/NAD(P)-binding protein [Helicobacter bilis]TLE06891.1 FAD/NAD(P)-binding protein [Helicobacter bilis]
MLNIGIVGFGARGLSIFERLVSKVLSRNISKQIHVYIFEPYSLGSGCHNPKQSRRMLANTVAAQMTIFADETICPNEFFIKGPNFYEYLISQGYSAEKNGYYARAMLGEYLEYSFSFIKTFIPKNMTLQHIQEFARSLTKEHDYFILKTNQHSIKLHAVFVTTGHTESNNNSNEFAAYPLTQSISNLSHKDIVAINGLGLSAIDIITLLTSGYGGYFEKRNDELVYHKSGKEPKILAFSRSNLPLMARAITQKETREQYQPVFFTQKLLTSLKQQKQQLDFQTDILPLIIKEMEYVYSYTYLARKSLKESFIFRNKYLLTDNVQQLLNQHIPKEKQFSFSMLIEPIKNITSAQDFKEKMIAYLQNDIQEVSLGNLTSPIKAACDVLRDTRDILRLCIDFGGLSENSYRLFIKSFIPLNNRLCVGPPLIKIQELLALIKADIVEILYNVTFKHIRDRKFELTDSFSNHYIVNRLINARIDNLRLQENEFLSSLLQNNLGSYFANGSIQCECLKINNNFQSINQDNTVIENLFILGLPTEGIKFYTFILPRPFIASTFLNDSNITIQSCLKGLGL